MHLVRFLAAQDGVGGDGAHDGASEEGVAVLQGETKDQLVEGDDDLDGDQVELPVVGHHEEQQSRVHRLVDDRAHEPRGVGARDRARG